MPIIPPILMGILITAAEAAVTAIILKLVDAVIVVERTEPAPPPQRWPEHVNGDVRTAQ